MGQPNMQNLISSAPRTRIDTFLEKNTKNEYRWLFISEINFCLIDQNICICARTGNAEQSIPEISLQGKPVESDHTIPAQTDHPFIHQLIFFSLAA